jgi:hypothetical protein
MSKKPVKREEGVQTPLPRVHILSNNPTRIRRVLGAAYTVVVYTAIEDIYGKWVEEGTPLYIDSDFKPAVVQLDDEAQARGFTPLPLYVLYESL